jgi:hypothetical protein
MKQYIESKSQRQAALVSGIAIVIMTIAAVVATDITIGGLIEENNGPETLKNISASKTIFNTGVLSWLIILICDVFAAWGLYIFFIHVSKNLSLMTAWFRLVYVAMLAVSIFNLIYVYLLIHQPGMSSSEISGQLSEKVMFYLNAFDRMFSVSLIVFGIHILLLGYMIYKSDYIPKILGIVLIVAFGGYAIPNISNLLFPDYKDVMVVVEWIFIIPMLGEVALGIWLLIISLKQSPNLNVE